MVENVAKCDKGDGLNGRISARKPVMTRDAGNLSHFATKSHFATIKKRSLPRFGRRCFQLRRFNPRAYAVRLETLVTIYRTAPTGSGENIELPTTP